MPGLQEQAGHPAIGRLSFFHLIFLYRDRTCSSACDAIPHAHAHTHLGRHRQAHARRPRRDNSCSAQRQHDHAISTDARGVRTNADDMSLQSVPCSLTMAHGAHGACSRIRLTPAPRSKRAVEVEGRYDILPCSLSLHAMQTQHDVPVDGAHMVSSASQSSSTSS